MLAICGSWDISLDQHLSRSCCIVTIRFLSTAISYGINDELYKYIIWFQAYSWIVYCKFSVHKIYQYSFQISTLSHTISNRCILCCISCIVIMYNNLTRIVVCRFLQIELWLNICYCYKIICWFYLFIKNITIFQLKNRMKSEIFFHILKYTN